MVVPVAAGTVMVVAIRVVMISIPFYLLWHAKGQQALECLRFLFSL